LRNAQNSLGRIAIALADTFNAQQRLGVDLNGTLGQDFFTQAVPSVVPNDGNKGNLVLTPTFSDTGKLTTSDYKLSVEADLSFTLTRLSDKQAIALPAGFPVTPSTTTFDGLTLTFASGMADAGDTFLIQPTATGARDFDVVLFDPSMVAAAAPVVVNAPTQNRGNGVITGGTVDASYLAAPLASSITLTYDSATNKFSGFPDGSTVTYSAGAQLNYKGINFSINGTPADHDTFTIAKNTGGVSDGRNALQLAGLQNKKTIGDNASSFNDAYAQLVSTVGNKTRQVQISSTAQTSLTAQIRASQQSVSGVNQDEETANLLIYQQMYQANAKVIQTASTMFDAILAIR
jgi:flagellar hook-associated protein 1 FlgK